MYRLATDHVGEIEIKKSKFICYLHKTLSEEDAKAFIQTVKKEHPNARHHCYAFIIGEHNEIQRSNDDGEPAGTAGIPMLECLMHHHMQDIVAVTVRYFGGIKLGAGGLIRAYAKSVSHALSTASITKKQQMKIYTLQFSYDLVGKLDFYFRNHQISILEKTYEEMVSYKFLCKTDISEDIKEISNGKFSPIFLEDTMIDIEIQITE